MMKLHPSFTKQIADKSGICHHMIFETKYVSEIFNIVSNYHNSKPFWTVFLENVHPNTYMHSGASEYELYFNFVVANHKEDILIRHLNWINTSNNNICADYDYISVHWYMQR